MFGKVKRWVGIEGVKMELIIPEEIAKKDFEIKGQLKFTTMHDQTVTAIKVKLIERYTLGRRKKKTSSEYDLGAIELKESFDVTVDTPIFINFVLPFELMISSMDEMEGKNFFWKGVAKLAKLERGVHSEYRIEAEAKVKDTKLDPFDRKPIRLK